MPITRSLEEALGAPALHLPLGRRSDSAHLPNERISGENLEAGVRIMRAILGEKGCVDERD